MDWDSSAWRNIEVISLSFAIAVQRIDLSVRLTVRLVSRATFEWCLRTSPPGRARGVPVPADRRAVVAATASAQIPAPFFTSHTYPLRPFGRRYAITSCQLDPGENRCVLRGAYLAVLSETGSPTAHWATSGTNAETTIGASFEREHGALLMANVRWLIFAAALAQTAPPQPPANLRIVNEISGCPSDQVGAPPNCFPVPPAPVGAGKQWTVTYSEEFNGTALDPTKLTPCFDWNYGSRTASFNTGKERYLPSQVQVSNGTAKMVAEPLAPPYANSACFQGQCTYKAGLVSTARPRADNGSVYLFPFTYGYIESRMKFPGTPGFFTAFWMLPTNPSFSYDTEIDIVEILGGHPDTIFMTITTTVAVRSTRRTTAWTTTARAR